MINNFTLPDFEYITKKTFNGKYFHAENEFIFLLKLLPNNFKEFYEKLNKLIRNDSFASFSNKKGAQFIFYYNGVEYSVLLPMEVLTITNKECNSTIDLKPKVQTIVLESSYGFQICTIQIDFSDFLSQLNIFSSIAQTN